MFFKVTFDKRAINAKPAVKLTGATPESPARFLKNAFQVGLSALEELFKFCAASDLQKVAFCAEYKSGTSLFGSLPLGEFPATVMVTFRAN